MNSENEFRDKYLIAVEIIIMFTRWVRKCCLNPILFVMYYMPLETRNLYFKARVQIHCDLMVKICEIKAALSEIR